MSSRKITGTSIYDAFHKRKKSPYDVLREDLAEEEEAEGKDEKDAEDHEDGGEGDDDDEEGDDEGDDEDFDDDEGDEEDEDDEGDEEEDYDDYYSDDEGDEGDSEFDDYEECPPRKKTRGEVHLSHSEKATMAKELKDMGNDAFRRNELDKAVELYSKSLQLVPDDAKTLSNRAFCHLKNKAHALALSDALQSLKVDPDWYKAYLHAAAAYSGVHDYKAALDILDKAIREIKPLHLTPNVTDLLGQRRNEVHETMRKMGLASTAHYHPPTGTDKKNKKKKNKSKNKNQNQKNEAEEKKAEMLQQQQKLADSERCRNQGNEAFKQKKYGEALTWFSKAIEFNPKCHLSYSNRSITQRLLGRNKEALEDAYACIGLDNAFGRGHHRVAEALKAQQQYSAADTYYQKAIQFETNAERRKNFEQDRQDNLDQLQRTLGPHHRGGQEESKSSRTTHTYAYHHTFILTLRLRPRPRLQTHAHSHASA